MNNLHRSKYKLKKYNNEFKFLTNLFIFSKLKWNISSSEYKTKNNKYGWIAES